MKKVIFLTQLKRYKDGRSNGASNKFLETRGGGNRNRVRHTFREFCINSKRRRLKLI